MLTGGAGHPGRDHGVEGPRLTAVERTILAAVADALLPSGGTPAPSATQTDTVDEVARLLRHRFGRIAGWAFRIALWVFELTTLVTHGRRFSRLDAAIRERVAARAAKSSNLIRAGQVTLLKHVIVNTYLSHEHVAAEIGYHRPDPLDPTPNPDGPRLTPLTWPELPEHGRLRCDAIVIGSGAGGAVVAATLAEAGLDVLMLEEGGYHTREEFTEQRPWHRFLDLYRDQGTTIALGLPPIPVPIGRAVGGTTVVNAGTSLRPPARVLREWVTEHGLEDARPEDLAPLLDEVERVQSVRPIPDEVLGVNAEVFRDATARMGHPGRALPRNIVDCRGSGECVFGCPTDAKQAVHLTWLPRAERAGARILARVRCDRVILEGGRATGVEATVLDPGRRDIPRGRLRIDAATVVVSAGAFHTPMLLDASDVPDRSGRRGRNLRLHPAIGLAADLGREVHAWRGTLQSWMVDALHGDGIMIEATTAPPPVSGAQLPGAGHGLKELLGSWSRVVSSGFLVTDTSSGRVRRGPAGRPVVTYQLQEQDRRRINRGLSFLSEAFAEAGATRILVGMQGRTWATPAEARALFEAGEVPARALKLSAYHPVGTHHLSADPRRGPADPWGRVHGTAGLWVADASVFPDCLGVNPQLTIMAFALRTARAIIAASPASAPRVPGQVAV